MTPVVPFFAIDLDGADWHTPDGYPTTICQTILVDTLDPVRRTGVRMLVMRFDPGAATEGTITHAEAEDVFVFSGDLVVGGADGEAAVTYTAPAFACRPGGVRHGPFASKTGCLMYVRFSFDTID
jgi:hypothetical protein